MSVYIKTNTINDTQNVVNMIKTSLVFSDETILYKTEGVIVYRNFKPRTTNNTPELLDFRKFIISKDVKKFMKNGVFQNEAFLEEFDQ